MSLSSSQQVLTQKNQLLLSLERSSFTPHSSASISELERESSMYLGLSVSSLIPHLLSMSEFPEVSGDLKFNN